MPEADSKLIIFAKAPIPGSVKTRLQPTVSQEDAATLQTYFIQQTLALASTLKEVDVELWCTPDDSHPCFQQCAGKYAITLRQQQGNDLGERMANALQEALAHYQQVVIIGTDCPELTPAYLMEAFLRGRPTMVATYCWGCVVMRHHCLPISTGGRIRYYLRRVRNCNNWDGSGTN